MLAAGQAAEDPDRPKPHELLWAYKIEKFGLPYPGTWMDQPAGLLDRIASAKSIYEAVRAWTKADDWGKLRKDQPQTWKLVVYYLKLKKSNE